MLALFNSWARLARHRFSRGGVIVCALFVVGISWPCLASDYEPSFSDKAPAANNIILFGVHPLHNPQRLYEVYQPLVNYLNSNILGLRFKLEASRNYAAYEEKLYAGHFHFALPNPYQTLMATQHGYRIFGKMGDDMNFRGIILVRRDSNITKVEDLKGKAVSYPAPTALAATLLPQWYLYSHGLDIKRDIENRYVGSQESSILNAVQGKVAAAATWPPPWLAFAKARPEDAAKMMVIWETEPLVNNGLVVRSDVPAELEQRVGRLLFALHTHSQGQDILAPMELSRFEPASDATYKPVREFLARFEAEVRPVQERK